MPRKILPRYTLGLLKNWWFKAGCVCVCFVVVLFIFSHSRPVLFFHNERFTIVWPTNPVWVTSINRQNGSVSLVRIPSDTYVIVPAGFGSFRIGVLWKLGMIEKLGGKILAAATQTFLGVPVDGWIGVKGETPTVDGSSAEVIHTLTSMVWPWNIKYSTQTNIRPIDRILLWFFLSGRTVGHIISVDLSKENVVIPTILADGTAAEIGDPELVDKVTQRLFNETAFQTESLVVRIYNGSGVAGAGHEVARLLTNIGVNVVGVGNTDERDTCQFDVPKQYMEKNIVRRISSLYPCSLNPKTDEGKEAQLYLGKNIRVGGFL